MSIEPRTHYADGFGMPVCRKLWRGHTKNEPAVTTQGGKVTCKQCRRRARICDPLDDHDHTKCFR